MWISKKMWNEMCDKVDNLKYLVNQLDVTVETRDKFLKNIEEKVEKLSKAHDEVKGETLFSYDIKDGIQYRQDSFYTHKVPTTSTKLIPNVTLEELAKLVIDETPIVREQTIKVKKEYGRGE